ncbi:MAG: DUF1700 domain-containing protein [Clostridiales bacterium]|jgi:uncharacterized membrane protein|nr:DUF1700 domain-containing protein [Clostridiales bacterium]
MTRDIYLSILRAELLKRLNQTRVAEIVSEWESHFALGSASGETDADIIARLGPPDRAAQVLTEDLQKQLHITPISRQYLGFYLLGITFAIVIAAVFASILKYETAVTSPFRSLAVTFVLILSNQLLNKDFSGNFTHESCCEKRLFGRIASFLLTVVFLVITCFAFYLLYSSQFSGSVLWKPRMFSYCMVVSGAIAIACSVFAWVSASANRFFIASILLLCFCFYLRVSKLMSQLDSIHSFITYRDTICFSFIAMLVTFSLLNFAIHKLLPHLKKEMV